MPIRTRIEILRNISLIDLLYITEIVLIIWLKILRIDHVSLLINLRSMSCLRHDN